MKDIVVENCVACEPISSAIEVLKNLGFCIQEQKLNDYHFKELYFLMRGDISKMDNQRFNGIDRVDYKLLCNCHWSTIELMADVK